jgi:hypothetical protein
MCNLNFIRGTAWIVGSVARRSVSLGEGSGEESDEVTGESCGGRSR